MGKVIKNKSYAFDTSSMRISKSIDHTKFYSIADIDESMNRLDMDRIRQHKNKFNELSDSNLKLNIDRLKSKFKSICLKKRR